jgi:hypothetical protein
MLKLIAVKPLPNHKLWLEYSNGTTGEVDLSTLVVKGVFQLLQDEQLFQKVSIANNRRLVWNEDLELCADALYLQITGQKPEALFPNLKNSIIHA